MRTDWRNFEIYDVSGVRTLRGAIRFTVAGQFSSHTLTVFRVCASNIPKPTQHYSQHCVFSRSSPCSLGRHNHVGGLAESQFPANVFWGTDLATNRFREISLRISVFKLPWFVRAASVFSPSVCPDSLGQQSQSMNGWLQLCFRVAHLRFCVDVSWVSPLFEKWHSPNRHQLYSQGSESQLFLGTVADITRIKNQHDNNQKHQ